MAKIPKYRRHSRNLGFVAWNGKRHYFSGKFDSPESRQEYFDFLAANCGDRPEPTPTKSEKCRTINDLAKAFLESCPRDNSEFANYRVALLQLVDSFGSCKINEFGPLKLRELQEKFKSPRVRQYQNKAGKVTSTRKYQMTRKSVNHLIGNVRRVFRWGVSRELVEANQLTALAAVPGLKRGEGPERPRRQPVDWADVERVLTALSPVLAAMVQIQWLTGCRPQDVCRIRPMDVDQSSEPWKWQPPEHKNSHRNQERVIFLGPQARTILSPWLSRKFDRYCFEPAESARFQHGGNYRPHFGAIGYSQSILYAISKIPDPPIGKPYSRDRFLAAGLPYWTPHQLRHSRGHSVRTAHGIEAAQAVLGHATLSATEIYSKKALELAAKIAESEG